MEAETAYLENVVSSSPVREAEIPAEMKQLEATINHLDEALNLLGERLQPVLRMSTPPTEGKDVAQSQTDLGQYLQARYLRLQSIIRTVDDLRDRCEL